MIGFELWDERSGNLMGSFAGEAEALAVMARAIQQHGVEYAEGVALVRVGPRGGLTRLAAGAALVRRAAASEAPNRKRVSA